jgi:chromosome segregation ATPase
MKYSVVIFLTFLFIGSFANKVQITDINAGDSLVEYIDNLKAEVVAEQNAHQTLAEQQDAECDKELKFRNNEVNDANNSLIASDTHLKKCQGALDQANTDLDNLAAQLEVVQNQLADLEEKRAADLALFQQHEQEHLDAITAVDEAFDILGEFENSNAAGVALLAQLGKHVTKQIKVSIASKFFMHYAPVIAFLAATPKDVTVSAEDLDKLNALFQKLKDNLQASLAGIRETEESDIEYYNNEKALYQSQIDTINAAIDNFAGYVVSMKRCIATETEVSSEAASKLSRNSKILENTQAMCAAFDQEYADASAARKEKISNLELLGDLVESKVAQYNAGGFYHSG